jgi:hypothetical protein
MDRSPNIQVRQASVTDLEALVPLFDGYRQFYGKPSDIPLARAFLLERFEHNQSVIFIATQPDGSAVGFTQLYPSFSSVSAARTFLLNDLFVAPAARRSGVGIKPQPTRDYLLCIGRICTLLGKHEPRAAQGCVGASRRE